MELYSVISSTERWRQENYEFEACLVYILSSIPARDMQHNETLSQKATTKAKKERKKDGRKEGKKNSK